MLGKRIMNINDSTIEPRDWTCAAICNWECLNTADYTCKCSGSTAKATSHDNVRGKTHMNSLISSGN